MADLRTALRSFEAAVKSAELVVSNVEALWQTAPRRSDVRRQITERELGALYEMSYLAIFGHWENFIEEYLVRAMAGQGTPHYAPSLRTARAASLKAARSILLDGKRFLLWHDPGTCVSRLADRLVSSPLEKEIALSQATIEEYAAVRHAIAHRSEEASEKFALVSKSLSGVAYSTPGALLRAQDHSDPLNPVRWLRKVSSTLMGVATAGVP